MGLAFAKGLAFAMGFCTCSGSGICNAFAIGSCFATGLAFARGLALATGLTFAVGSCVGSGVSLLHQGLAFAARFCTWGVFSSHRARKFAMRSCVGGCGGFAFAAGCHICNGVWLWGSFTCTTTLYCKGVWRFQGGFGVGGLVFAPTGS